jgi:hypothetical protein
VGASYQFQKNNSSGTLAGDVPSSSLNDYQENLFTMYLSLVF